MPKKKKSKRYVKAIIKDIKKLTTDTIPHEIQKGKFEDVNAYISSSRTALNILLVEAMLGCEIKTKGDGKVKFNHRLPRKKDIAEVCELLEDFIENVENPLLAHLTGMIDEDSEETTVVPKFEMKINGKVQRVRMLDKPSNKKLKKEIFDKDMIRNVKIDVNDCLNLASMGEDARNKANRNKMLIVGGIAILITGTAVAGLMIYHHMKDDDLSVGDELVDGDIPDIIDMDDIGDIPQVDI